MNVPATYGSFKITLEKEMEDEGFYTREMKVTHEKVQCQYFTITIFLWKEHVFMLLIDELALSGNVLYYKNIGAVSIPELIYFTHGQFYISRTYIKGVKLSLIPL